MTVVAARPGPAGPRAIAAGLLTEVRCRGRSLSSLLPNAFRGPAAAVDRALVQELCFGVLRWQARLEAVLDRLLRRPIKPRDADLHSLLLIGLYQILYLRVPDHAAVSETVAATRELGRPWARGLVNATLRAFLRQRERLLAEVDRDEVARYAHAEWFIDRVRTDWPDHWRAILEAANERPPMGLRVNLARITREDYLERLAGAGIEARAHPLVPSAIELSSPLAVESLPGFRDGLVSVQDAAAQIAAGLLAPESGQRVLDACAAPGGKTGHLLEAAGRIDLSAIDRDPGRLAAVRENLDRLGLEARLLTADAASPGDWWDGRPFDRILLDAPCSATGVIRRHPDIKWLRRPADLERLATEQTALLEAMAGLLRSGGRLLYATCSVVRDENEARIRHFLDRHGDFRVVPLPSFGAGVDVAVGRQILPGEAGMDGFFYACLEKR